MAKSGRLRLRLLLCPCTGDDNQRHQFHWFIEIIPRIFERDGFQLGTSITKLSMLPDAAAEVLRAGLAARQGGEGNPSGPDAAT